MDTFRTADTIFLDVHGGGTPHPLPNISPKNINYFVLMGTFT